jgi:hypothetical protein
MILRLGLTGMRRIIPIAERSLPETTETTNFTHNWPENKRRSPELLRWKWQTCEMDCEVLMRKTRTVESNGSQKDDKTVSSLLQKLSFTDAKEIVWNKPFDWRSFDSTINVDNSFVRSFIHSASHVHVVITMRLWWKKCRHKNSWTSGGTGSRLPTSTHARKSITSRSLLFFSI